MKLRIADLQISDFFVFESDFLTKWREEGASIPDAANDDVIAFHKAAAAPRRDLSC